jgi:hypothetical protein
MIRNLIEVVDDIVRGTLAAHVTRDDDLDYAINVFTETALVGGEKGMSVVQTQCLGIWLILETEHERLSTRWSCAIEDWTEETIRSELVTVWDALVVHRMEQDLKRS